jgi:hypothetical protein
MFWLSEAAIMPGGHRSLCVVTLLVARATLTNPEGCRDWWGYDDPNYPLKSGRQMMAVDKMLQRISRGTQ